MKGLLYISLALVSCFIARGEPPRINNVQIDGDAIVVSITAPTGARRVGLEGRPRANGSAWTPRALHRFETQLAAPTLVQLRLQRSENVEVLRVRSDETERLPPSFYSGQTQFAEWGVWAGTWTMGFDRSQGQTVGGTTSATSTGTTTGTGTTTASTGGTTSGGTTGTTTGGPTPLQVVESDIWKVDGGTIYYFNQQRGLQKIDVSNPDRPSLKGTFDLPASGEQMYFLTNGFVVLLAHGGCDHYAPGDQSRLFVIDTTTMARVAELQISGTVKESRLVGNVLYVASNDWRPNSQTQWERGTSVISVDLNDPRQPVIRKTSFVPGEAQAISATDKFLFVATASAINSTRSDLAVFDITSATGDFTQASTLTASGRILDKFKLNVDADVLTVVSQQQEGFTPSTVLENYSLTNAVVPARMGATVLASGEQLYATRFDTGRIYVVTYRRTDPFWIVDNSDPAHPRVAGELRVPGWSTYLKPMGNRVLAMGIDDTNTQRVAVSLFDVSNAQSPALLSKVIMGTSWSWSEANADEKALTVLPEAGLILAPWQSAQGAFFQLIDFSHDTLTARGVITNSFYPRRATLISDHAISVSQGDLVSYDATDRDHPALKAQLQLSSRVTQAIPIGDYIVQFNNALGGGASMQLVAITNRDVRLTNVVFTNATRIVGLTLHDDKLFVAVAGPAFRMEVWDVSGLPSLRKLGEVAFPDGETIAPMLKALWLKPSLLVWTHENSSAAFTNPIGTGTTTGTTVGVGTTSSAGDGGVMHENPGLTGKFVAFDVSDAAAPRFVSSAYVALFTDESFLVDGLIYTTHHQQEFLNIPPTPEPPPSTNILAASKIHIHMDTSVLGGGANFTILLSGGSTGTFTISEGSVGSGLYTLSAGSPQFHLLLNYGGEFQGDVDDYLFEFRASSWGSFTGNQRAGQQLGLMNGTFAVGNDLPPGSPGGAGATNDPGPLIVRSYLDVIDFSDPDAPIIRRPLNMPATLVGVSMDGSLLYTIGRPTTGQIDDPQYLQVSAYDGVSIHLVDSKPLPPPSAAAVHGEDIFVLANSPTNAIERWHLSAAGTLEKSGAMTMPGRVWAIRFEGNLALVAFGDRVESYDVTDPANWKPKAARLIECATSPSFENIVMTADGSIWIPLDDYGLVEAPVVAN